jgi:hypothetical protein
VEAKQDSGLNLIEDNIGGFAPRRQNESILHPLAQAMVSRGLERIVGAAIGRGQITRNGLQVQQINQQRGKAATDGGGSRLAGCEVRGDIPTVQAPLGLPNVEGLVGEEGRPSVPCGESAGDSVRAPSASSC